MNTSFQKSHSIVRTHLSQNNSEARPNGLYPAMTPNFSTTGAKKCVPKIIGSILYYTHAVDMKVLMALSTIPMLHAKPTKNTIGCCIQLFDYLAMNADAKIRFYPSNMIMNIHLDAFYLSESKAPSRACGHFFMGWKPFVDNQSSSMEHFTQIL
jgi:hypothetical protein